MASADMNWHRSKGQIRMWSFLILLMQCSLVESFTTTLQLGSHRPNAISIFAPNSVHRLQHEGSCRSRSKSRNGSRLYMGKGDGKKKRKKKTAAAPSAPSTEVAIQPLRVSNDINIPVKRQIRWAKMNQEYRKAGTSFRQINTKKKTAYRKRLDEEEQQQVMEDKRHRNAEVDWSVILSHGNGTSVGALMLVDGYNVIYQWPRLKKQMMNGNTQRAREMLLRDLEELHNIKGWRIECVFDGFGRNTGSPLGSGPGGHRVASTDREFNRYDTGRGVRIVFSGVGASADSYIEKRCLEAKEITQGKLSVSSGSLIAVSNDGMIRMVATGAGALSMSSDRLVDELKSVKKVTAFRVEAAMAIANGSHMRPDGMNKAIRMPSMQGARGTGANQVGLVATADGKQVVNTFRGGQFIVEDKRKNKSKIKKKENTEAKKKAEFGDLVQGTQETPSWAIVPDAAKFDDN